MKAESNTRGRIYIADNNPVYRDLLKLMLEQQGHSVRLFEDGYYLLKALRVNKTANIQLPDLIICELNMRVIDGFALLDEIRNSMQYPAVIPFIFLTDCSSEEAMIQAAKQKQCKVFSKSELLKPLIETIYEVLPTSTITQILR